MPGSVPLRKCVACGLMKPKSELIRIVRSSDMLYGIDGGGKLPGRGAYVCKITDCAEKAKKQKKLERSFRGKIPAQIYDDILGQV
ncbi:MAG: YlxR family protein [Oscillospiraceae bacterium]|nr:YlxR family protein [Oscillospiraceae bacterium]